MGRETQINYNDEANYKRGFHDAVEKACKWLKKNLPYIVCKINASEYWLGKSDFIETFRKAMEERL